MSSERLFREVADAWASQDWDRWVQTCASDYHFDPGVGPVRDLVATLVWNRAVFVAYPDYRQRIERIVVGGRRVAGILTATGTFTGSLVTADVTIPPTGRGFSLPYLKVLEWDADGKVARDFQVMDYTAMT